jgi:hypothetical protein
MLPLPIHRNALAPLADQAAELRTLVGGLAVTLDVLSRRPTVQLPDVASRALLADLTTASKNLADLAQALRPFLGEAPVISPTALDLCPTCGSPLYVDHEEYAGGARELVYVPVEEGA